MYVGGTSEHNLFFSNISFPIPVCKSYQEWKKSSTSRRKTTYFFFANILVTEKYVKQLTNMNLAHVSVITINNILQSTEIIYTKDKVYALTCQYLLAREGGRGVYF